MLEAPVELRGRRRRLAREVRLEVLVLLMTHNDSDNSNYTIFYHY